MPENPQPETAQLSQYGDILFCGRRIWGKIHVLVDYDPNNRAAMVVCHLLHLRSHYGNPHSS
jgi:hypothetical protein